MNKYSLIRENWIPITNGSNCSLLDVFSNKSILDIGRNPIEKLSLFKLFLAIGQTVWTPENNEEWKNSNQNIFSSSVISYLLENEDKFYLYGDKPFLQFPILKDKIVPKSCYLYLPQIASGNNVLIFDSQKEIDLSHSDKALILISLMNFAFAGKKVDNTISLSKDYIKSKGSYEGFSLGFLGYLHSFLEGRNLLETIYINIITKQDIKRVGYLTEGLGAPPWDEMPTGESNNQSDIYKRTYLGSLIAMNRFVLLNENSNDLFITEGITNPASYKEGIADLTCTLYRADNKQKIIWCDNARKPWIQFPALLSFLQATETVKAKSNLQMELTLPRIRTLSSKYFKIWCGGLAVSNNSGEQYISGKNDFINSEQEICIDWLNFLWYARVQNEIKILSEISRILYVSIKKYFDSFNSSNIGKLTAEKGTNLFWIKAEPLFKTILKTCSQNYSSDDLNTLRKEYIKISEICYSSSCPYISSRQIASFIKESPTLTKFLIAPDGGKTNV